ncbi:hypothetical protein [Aureimonas pseudogalii]|uniref:Uncharacterized protein n=1 Tax=Aureimonas pseudogalii TaxID=1744844 RepID=A0A7W6H3H8_9HYPH|nr:hypothetical protein [Aureimonas pseudogalii]MBB3997187.1 hypothetical protein [Aureimonas pseudogalii]
MAQIIEVPGMGEVEFPADMSDADISAAIQRSLGAQSPSAAPADVAPAAAPAPTPAVASASPQPDPTKPDALSSSVMAGGDVLTFGFGDELGAAMGVPIEAVIGAYNGADAGKSLMDRIRDGYDRGLRSRRELMDYAQQEHPVASAVGSIAATAALPSVGAKSLPGMLAQGAAAGGVYGFGSGEGGFENRRDNALTGGALGLAGAAVGNAVGRTIMNRAAREALPTREGLRALSKQAFDDAEAAGVVVAPKGIQRLTADITDDLADFGYDPALQPRVGVVLNRLGTLSENPVTLKGMDVLRRVARGAAQSSEPSERALGAKIIDKIDSYLDDIPADEVMTGNADQGSKALRQARDYWGRMRRLEAVEEATAKAERRAASTGSGGNADNAMRQNIRAILDNPKRSAGYSKAERAAMEQVVRGTPTQNAARLVGKLSPQGNGLMAALGVGGTAAVPAVTIPAMVAGVGAKRFADGATTRNIAALSDIIRGGGQTVPDVVKLGRQGLGPAAIGVQRGQMLNDRSRLPLSILLGQPFVGRD